MSPLDLVTDLQTALRARQNKRVVTWGREVVFTRLPHCGIKYYLCKRVQKKVGALVFSIFIFSQTKLNSDYVSLRCGDSTAKSKVLIFLFVSLCVTFRDTFCNFVM